MKLIILAFICILNSYVGFYVSRKYKDRVILLSDLYEFIEKSIFEISFSKKDINKIIKSLDYKSKDFKTLTIKYLEFLSTQDKKTFLETTKYLLNKKDYSFVVKLYLSLGDMDYKSQINSLNAAKEYVEKLKIEAEKDYMTKGKLYFKLGLVVGIMFMILLV